MDKKIVQTPLMKMLNPLYHFNTKEEEERDFQAIRMYKMEEGSTVCKTENLVGTDVFLIEDQLREDDLKFQNEQKSPISKESIKDKFCKPYRRDVEVIRTLKRMHIEKASSEWKKKLQSSSVLAHKSKYIKTTDGFQPAKGSASDYVDWAYDNTMRNVKTTRNFILAIADKLKTYEDSVSQSLLPKIEQTKKNPYMPSTDKLSSSMGQQSSKSLFTNPATVITGKSLSEKLERLEKQLKKKEALRNNIDPGMYNFQHKVQRLNSKGARQSFARNSSSLSRQSVMGRNSTLSRSSVMSTASSSRTDLSNAGSLAPSPMYSPKAPTGKKQLSSVPRPGRKHRKLSVSKGGVQASDKEVDSPRGDPSEMPEFSSSNLNSCDNNNLSQTSLQAPMDSSPSVERKEKIKDSSEMSPPRAKLDSTIGQNSFAEKIKNDHKSDTVEVLTTTQYYSSPNKLCKTTPGEFIVLNGNLMDDPKKKHFHPLHKEKNKVKVDKKNSNYVADIMRIGLSNKEINEREKLFVAQKKKLGIPKGGYIEGIRSKNNKNLFKIQKETIVQRQILNRRVNEFKALKRDFTKKGIEAATKKELSRPSYRQARLHDLSVEDSMWYSKVASEKEKQQSMFFGGESEVFNHYNSRLEDVSGVSDFQHLESKADPPTPKRPPIIKRMDSTSEKKELELKLAKKVFEHTNNDIQSTVLNAHRKVSGSSHGEISPRAGENTFLESQIRMEDIATAKEIQYLEENKWIILVVDLVNGLAAKRKAMEAKNKDKSPEERPMTVPKTPKEVFVFIACLLRIILVGGTIGKDTFYLLVQKVFSKNDHHNVVSNQVLTLVRQCLNVSPQEYCDFLKSIGLEPPQRLIMQINNAKKKKRIFAKVKVAGAMAHAMKEARKASMRRGVNNQVLRKSMTLRRESSRDSSDGGIGIAARGSEDTQDDNESIISDSESHDFFDSKVTTRRNTMMKLDELDDI